MLSFLFFLQLHTAAFLFFLRYYMAGITRCFLIACVLFLMITRDMIFFFFSRHATPYAFSFLPFPPSLSHVDAFSAIFFIGYDCFLFFCFHDTRDAFHHTLTPLISHAAMLFDAIAGI